MNQRVHRVEKVSTESIWGGEKVDRDLQGLNRQQEDAAVQSFKAPPLIDLNAEHLCQSVEPVRNLCGLRTQ